MAGIRIEGRVMHADGSAAPRVEVQIWDLLGDDGPLWAGDTDDSGAFCCEYDWPSEVFLPWMGFHVSEGTRSHSGPWRSWSHSMSTWVPRVPGRSAGPARNGALRTIPRPTRPRVWPWSIKCTRVPGAGTRPPPRCHGAGVGPVSATRVTAYS